MHANQIATIRKTAELTIASGQLRNDITVDQLVDHMILVKEIGDEGGVDLQWSKFPLGTTRETLVAAIEAQRKTNKRRAGAKAVADKYGKDAARRITGHTIR